MPVPEEKTDRNKELYKEYKKGTSIVDLVAKYRISSARIFQLIHRYEEKHGIRKV